MFKKSAQIVALAMFLAIALRIYLLNKPGYTIDIGSFLDWGTQIKNNGFWSLFGGNYYQSNGIDYPFLVPLITSWWLTICGNFKLLPTIFEIAIIIISVVIVQKSSVRYKAALTVAIILQPALALVSSGWGQVDSIFSLLVIFAFALANKSKYLTTILIFGAFLAKPQAIPAVAIYALYLILQKNRREFFQQAIFFIVLLAIPIVIFRICGHSSFLSPYTEAVGHYKNISLNAFNFWWIFWGQKAWNIADTSVFLASYKNIGLILFAIFEIPALIFLSRSRKTLVDLMLVLSYTYLVFFVFPTEIHERYLFPAIAFAGLAALRDRKIFIVYLILTVTFLVNCFAVLQSVYPQFEFLRINLLAGDWTKLVAIANLLTVAYLAMYFIFESHGKISKKS